MKKGLVAMILLSLFASGSSFAQRNTSTSDDESKIRALESAWNLAEQEKNTGALDQMLAPTFVYTEFDGSFSNKSQFLKNVKTAPVNSDQITNQDVSVYLYGNTAIVTGAYKERGVENGKAFTRRGRFTDAWIKQDGTWLCVASQATLTAPASHAQ